MMASSLRLLQAPTSQQRRCGLLQNSRALVTCNSSVTTSPSIAPSIRNNDTIQISDDGLYVTTELRPKQTALEIPASEWLTVRTVASSPLGPAVAMLEPWLQLALYLIHTDSEAGVESDTLPLLWTAEERALLVGSQLAASMEGYAAYFAAKHAELASSVYAANPSLFPSDRFTEAALVRAACNVRASTHPPLEGDRIAIVPGLRLAHSRRQGGVLLVKAGGLFGGEEKLVWEAGEAGLPAGQALALDMTREGSRVDSQMVLDYGARVFGGGQSAARDTNVRMCCFPLTSVVVCVIGVLFEGVNVECMCASPSPIVVSIIAHHPVNSPAMCWRCKSLRPTHLQTTSSTSSRSPTRPAPLC